MVIELQLLTSCLLIVEITAMMYILYIDEFYYHYYRYYYRRVTPKVDVRIVIAVSITVISACQWYIAWNNYNSAVNYLLQVPKHRMKAMEIAKKERLIETDKKKLRGKSKVRSLF